MMFYKVKDVSIVKDYLLLIVFENNTKKTYDISPLFEKFTAFKALKDDYDLFQKVRVDKGGYGISWNDEIDLSCNELWYGGNLYED